jgi:hypothetical protein
MANIQVRGRASFMISSIFSVSDVGCLGSNSPITNFIRSLKLCGGLLLFFAIIDYEVVISICYIVVLLNFSVGIPASGIHASHIRILNI